MNSSDGSFIMYRSKNKKNAVIDSDSESDSSEDDTGFDNVEDSFEDDDKSLPIDDANSDPKDVVDDSCEEDVPGTNESQSLSVVSEDESIEDSYKEDALEAKEDRSASLISEDENESIDDPNIVFPSATEDSSCDEAAPKVNGDVLVVSEDESVLSDIEVLLEDSVLVDPEDPQEEVVITGSKPPIQVSIGQFKEQETKVNDLQVHLARAQEALNMVNLKNLPDKGKLLIEKSNSLKKAVQEQQEIMRSMVVVVDEKPKPMQAINVPWEEIEAGVSAVVPRTLGAKGVARFKAEKTMAVETLDELHKSLANCPTENDVMEDPKGLKVPLMQHQKRALAWLLWREQQKPSGGILADDMGLGKTLTMITVVIKSLQLESSEHDDKENYRDKYPGGTLIVCPASLLNQWTGEVERRTKRGLLSVDVHHGAKREDRAKRLAKYDMVVTTYAIVLSEYEKNGTLFGVRWRRIILDEAHQIRNHKTRTSIAVCQLSAKSRWALSGTPVHNKELDMYSLLKFLRCSPFDDLQVWRTWVSDKSTGGQARLHAVLSSLMLRRTKAELMDKGILKSLPERTWELVSVMLDKDEMNVYQKVLIFSRTLFAQFLHQKALKNEDYGSQLNGAQYKPNQEYFKVRDQLLKHNKVKEVNQTDILVLLLRLRQICCHPSLITKMLEGNEDLGNADDAEEAEELNLLEQINKISLNDDGDTDKYMPEQNEKEGLKEASKGYLNPTNPVFQETRLSSKIHVLVKLLKEKIRNEDKAIVVSQWTQLLSLVAIQLRQERIIFDRLDGSIQVNKRMAIVDDFNDPKNDTRVLLLSLTAGGVGLNLVGANHLFLLDLHWNPQLENQAQDRIYRMGQTKPIFVYKFMALETIEERIKTLQESKLAVADAMLTGSKKVTSSKLTLQDLKMLFDFK